MTSCVKPDIRSDETVVANGNESFVEHCEIKVGKEVFAHGNMTAIVAVKRLIDNHSFARLA